MESLNDVEGVFPTGFRFNIVIHLSVYNLRTWLSPPGLPPVLRGIVLRNNPP